LSDRTASDTPDSRTAVLVGFSKGLEDALFLMLASSHHSIIRIASTTKAIELLETRHVDLVVASGRCPAASVVKLTESLGRPRETRVIVLLAGHDPEAERRYRESGLKYVMHMPVNAEDLLRVVQSTR
jgi:two-component SAPR family response regulator